MSGQKSKKELVGPWRSLHLVIWLLGLYILGTRNWWWPGILILVGISAIYEGLLQRFLPNAYEETTATQPVDNSNPSNGPSQEKVTYVTPEHRTELLPQVCPNCNAPVRGNEVRWTGPQSANCAYCGTNLPLNKA